MDIEAIKAALIAEEANLHEKIALHSAELRGVQSALKALQGAQPQARKHSILPRCREWVKSTNGEFTVHDLRAGNVAGKYRKS